MKFHLPAIRHDFEGFLALTRLYSQTRDCLVENIEIDMRSVDWFDADMCSVFGAILYSLGNNLNNVALTNISPPVEQILSKNGFLVHYGQALNIVDHWETTISYNRFDIGQNRYFSDYIDNEFINREEIPQMSHALLKKFRESLFEIFSNAMIHSGTKLGVFSCGQFFPNRNRLNFTVVDLGVGIRKKVSDYLKSDISPEQAIEWATEGTNTTKKNTPGGLGLRLLCDFIDLNSGRIQIVSDAGYWCREDRNTITRRLDHSLLGTAVNLEINTADTRSYRLSHETRLDDIF